MFRPNFFTHSKNHFSKYGCSEEIGEPTLTAGLFFFAEDHINRIAPLLMEQMLMGVNYLVLFPTVFLKAETYLSTK